jgi:hypothetical protein
VPTVSSLAKSLNAQVDARTSDCCLIELGPDDSPISGSGGSLVFQYYPESVTDTKAVNYQQKEIFGASLPLYQYIGSGERLISFTAQFTCDVDLLNTPDSTGATDLYQRLKNAGQERRNIDIRAAVMWLRQYVLPSYQDNTIENQLNQDSGGTQLTMAPRKLILCMPGTGIGFAGGDDGLSGQDSVPCLMTQCDVTYEALFPSGLPRAASIQLAFGQIGQLKGAVTFPSRTKFYDDVRQGRGVTLGYNLPPKGKRVSFT